MPLNLNWREISLLTDALKPRIEGMFVDRVIIPARERFPDGYLKGEWALRLTSRREELTFVFSIRPRHPYIALIEGKGPKAAQGSTHSALGLALAKHLKGARLVEMQALPRERTVVLWFAPEGEDSRQGLVLSLIPATPEALLVKESKDPQGWPILARSRTKGGVGLGANERFVLPDGAKAPLDPPVKTSTPVQVLAAIDSDLEAEAFEQRLTSARRSLRDLAKQARDRARQSETAIREAGTEPDWQRFGDLLKASLGDPPPLVKRDKRDFRALPDFETGAITEVPCDPKLAPAAQTEKFYHQAHRKARRASEAKSRLETATQALERAEKLLAIEPAGWPELEKIERASGTVFTLPTKGGPAAKQTGAPKGWLGRVFLSKENLAILVGRSKDENLELTFKIARGNDMWLHVRGKPGAHVVIPLHAGKSASLDTLLDAATLCIHYSGGERWGKTEVDYTFKKYVKRIRDSTEASYTQNKTLIVEPDPVRLKRLLDQQA